MKTKLNEQQKNEIYQASLNGKTRVELAKKYGVAACTISGIANRVKFTCSKCGKVQFVARHYLNRKLTDMCRVCVGNSLIGTTRKNCSREKHGSWKGGSYISSDGYRMIRDESTSGYVREHIHVYELHLGRRINSRFGGSGETVHHIDGNKLNNSIDNLVLISGSQEHRNVHAQLQQISYQLIRDGVIGFDRNTNSYFLRKIDESE